MTTTGTETLDALDFDLDLACEGFNHVGDGAAAWWTIPHCCHVPRPLCQTCIDQNVRLVPGYFINWCGICKYEFVGFGKSYVPDLVRLVPITGGVS